MSNIALVQGYFPDLTKEQIDQLERLDEQKGTPNNWCSIFF